MTLRHRHLEIDPSTPVDDLPLDALDDLLDRGDFDDWRAFARAVRSYPHGPLSERILSLCRAHEMYGTSRLWPAFIERVRRPASDDDEPAMTLAALRRRRGQTQAQLARALGISQSDVSKLERRKDLRLSTVHGYVRALGGECRIRAQFDTDDVRLDL